MNLKVINTVSIKVAVFYFHPASYNKPRVNAWVHLCSTPFHEKGAFLWQAAFFVILWNTWLERNRRVLMIRKAPRRRFRTWLNSTLPFGLLSPFYPSCFRVGVPFVIWFSFFFLLSMTPFNLNFSYYLLVFFPYYLLVFFHFFWMKVIFFIRKKCMSENLKM